MQSVSLDQLSLGQTAVVSGVSGTDSIAARLMELGIFEGESITLVGAAPLGDPKEFRVCDSSISLRRSEMQRVSIELPAV